MTRTGIRCSSAAKALATVDERLSAIVPWEDWLTLLITAVVFMSVVHSVDSAHWVDNMPSLYPMAFAGLFSGYLLSRVRRHALMAQPVALLLGATLVYLQLLAILPGDPLTARTGNMLDRMHIWWYAVTNNGISSDPLPFIVLMLVCSGSARISPHGRSSGGVTRIWVSCRPASR